MSPRPTVPLPGCSQRSYRRDLARRQHGRCHYCGRVLTEPPRRGGPRKPTDATIDHKDPVSRGGTDDPANLVVACLACNEAKGCSTESEFRAWRARGGRAQR